MWEVVVRGAVTGYAIALPVGAVAAYLVALTARTSLRVGVPAALGVATTDGLYALVAVMGGAAVADVVAPVAGTLRTAAGVVLLGVAVVGLLRALKEHARPPGLEAAPGRRGLTPLRAYVALLLITAVNPATVVYFMAVVLGDAHLGDASTGQRLLFAGAAFTASASWQLVVVSGGAFVGHVLTGQRGRLVTAIVSSVVIAGLAVRMLVS